MKVSCIPLLVLFLAACSKSAKEDYLFEGMVQEVSYVRHAKEFNPKNYLVTINDGSIRIYKDYVLVMRDDGSKVYIQNKDLDAVTFE